MAITEAPFDETGNMVSWPGPSYHNRYSAVQMREVPPFKATMKVVGMETGRSAKRVILEDQETGIRYPMFVADMVKLLEETPVTATWGPAKRGQNYGLKHVKV
jgi:hypothetical protein